LAYPERLPTGEKWPESYKPASGEPASGMPASGMGAADLPASGIPAQGGGDKPKMGIKGSLAAVKHGGAGKISLVEVQIPAAVQEIAQAICELPYIEAMDMILVEGLAWKIAQRRMIYGYLTRTADGDVLDKKGKPRASWQVLSSIDSSIRRDCEALGIGPHARASLLGAVAQTRNAIRVGEATDALRAKHVGGSGD
jgi:hypothetical protein